MMIAYILPVSSTYNYGIGMYYQLGEYLIMGISMMNLSE